MSEIWIPNSTSHLPIETMMTEKRILRDQLFHWVDYAVKHDQPLPEPAQPEVGIYAITLISKKTQGKLADKPIQSVKKPPLGHSCNTSTDDCLKPAA
jgi:hypothetical protein